MRGTTPHYRSSPDVIENQIKAARLSNPDYQFGMQELETNAFGDEVEIVMGAGDILYFPAGMWHKVETLDEGVSINISLMGTTYASLLCRTLEQILLEKEEWREIICSNCDKGNDAVEKLKTLVNDLPSILEKSQKDGLVEGILPPVLRHPPGFELVPEEMEVEQVESECEVFGEDISKGEGKEESDLQENSSDCEEGQEDSSIQNNEEIIVDIDEFEMPESFTCIAPAQKYWKKNPLASLMRMSDVTSFFEYNLPCNVDLNKYLYVLNINFAGNETHESTVRVVLKDKSGKLELLCSLKGKKLDDAIKELGSPPSALIYYGYLL